MQPRPDLGPRLIDAMTTDAVFGNWQNWPGQNLAVAHTHSIQSTSERPASIQ